MFEQATKRTNSYYLTRTLLVNKAGLEHAKSLIGGYKQGKIGEMNAELWNAKKIVDSTLHPGRCCQPRVVGC
jgi:hypothetical protein